MSTDEHGNEQCRGCGMHVINDDHVYVCMVCDWESCPDCAGRCGCPDPDE